MDIETKLTRVTSIELSQQELEQAIRDYLRSKNVHDYDKQLILSIRDTRADAGYITEVELKNYNKDNNLIKQIKDG